MPSHLKRYCGAGDLHFVTFSCHDRRPFLRNPKARDLFLEILEEERDARSLYIVGYVVMPEHIHLLIGEPKSGEISTFLKTVKQRSSRDCTQTRHRSRRRAGLATQILRLQCIYREEARREVEIYAPQSGNAWIGIATGGMVVE